ncbi:hypothetical protein GTP23_12105 [Pseudoduganella sp. FT93W]|uniref:Uncharacterized protein n=1 Tax=Duganella fentianensis TaxID=2692177 RepID=A0A845HXB4_9BURK|nr:hypothetical protein [Duganella fentianensis]MYN45790.1 hypothetical protein [Duganella fentianensis]
MDETQSKGSNWDAWTQAVLGNAINAAIDRVAARPQLGSDPSQAYGIDERGNIYRLGQTNAQISAQVQTNKAGTVAGLPVWLIVGAVVLFAIEAK